MPASGQAGLRHGQIRLTNSRFNRRLQLQYLRPDKWSWYVPPVQPLADGRSSDRDKLCHMSGVNARSPENLGVKLTVIAHDNTLLLGW